MPTLNKIALIGASQGFTPGLLRDAIHLARFSGDFVIYDCDETRADIAGQVCTRIVGLFPDQPTPQIRAGSDPSLLRNADVIFILVGTEHQGDIRAEIELFEQCGLPYSLMDSYGLPLITRLLRAFPNFANIACTISEQAPKALVVQVSNPMAMLTRFMQDHLPSQTCYGICNGYGQLPWRFPDLEVTGGEIFGFNHGDFIGSVSTPGGEIKGSELGRYVVDSPSYAFSRRALQEYGAPLLLEDHHTLQFFPEWSTGIPFHGLLGRKYWDARLKTYREREQEFAAWASGELAIPYTDHAADDPAFTTAWSILHNTPLSYTINDRNGGGLPFLNPDAITEYVTQYKDFRRTQSTPLGIQVPSALRDKLREMDDFYSHVYAGVLSRNVDALISATAHIYRNTPLTQSAIAKFLYSHTCTKIH